MSLLWSQEKGRSRYDFDTEEQWQEYKSVKEANPKAAFQFGVKMTEGRKAHKDLGKNRDQKLSNQLGKIKNILEKDVSAAACCATATPSTVPLARQALS